MLFASSKALSGQTIFDLVNKFYGSMDYLSKFIEDNNLSNGVNFDFAANPQTPVVYESTFVPNPVLKIPVAEAVSSTQYYIGLEGQTLFDVCLHAYGSLDNYGKLLADNSIDSLTIGSLHGFVFSFDATLRSDGMLIREVDRRSLVFSNKDYAQAALISSKRITENWIVRITENSITRITE